MRKTKTAAALLDAASVLSDAVDAMAFAAPVTHVYNPLRYAWAAHEKYVTRFATSKRRVVFLGMNPGPFGMAQTGVPFGEVATVREWMGIEADVGNPPVEHEKRPIQGFACTRSEVSGSRLWGLFAERYGTAKDFFRDHFVANYCPLVFLEESGKNRTPDKLAKDERLALEAACDAHLMAMLSVLKPQLVVGVGKFAEARAQRVLGDDGPKVGSVLHPSPASPKANRGWARFATEELTALDAW